MIRICVLVEGQTEEAFVNELLVPHYARMGRYLTPIIVSTGRGRRGGVVGYFGTRSQIVRLCKQDIHAHVTTLFDLYALPSDFPGRRSPAYPASGSGHDKAGFLESELARDIGLDAIREACPHFDGWLTKLEDLASQDGSETGARLRTPPKPRRRG